MFCTKCGKQNKEEALFCCACGAPIKRGLVQNKIERTPTPPAPAYTQPVYNQPVYNQPVYTYPGYMQPSAPVYTPPAAPIYQQPAPVAPVAATPKAPQRRKVVNQKTMEKKAQFEQNMRSKWRNVIASPFMLVVVILYSLSLLLSLLDTSMLYDMLSDLTGDIFHGMGALLVCVIVVALIPSVMTVLGLWLTYLEGRKKEKQEISIVGLQLIRIGQIIMLSFTGLFFVSLLLGSCAAGEAYYYGMLMVKLLLIAFAVCIYLFINIKSIGHSIYIVRLGVPHSGGVVPLLVGRFLMLCVSILLFVATVSTYFSIALLINLIVQAAMIAYIFVYKTKMEYVEAEFDRLF